MSAVLWAALLAAAEAQNATTATWCAAGGAPWQRGGCVHSVAGAAPAAVARDAYAKLRAAWAGGRFLYATNCAGGAQRPIVSPPPLADARGDGAASAPAFLYARSGWVIATRIGMQKRKYYGMVTKSKSSES